MGEGRNKSMYLWETATKKGSLVLLAKHTRRTQDGLAPLTPTCLAMWVLALFSLST